MILSIDIWSKIMWYSIFNKKWELVEWESHKIIWKEIWEKLNYFEILLLKLIKKHNIEIILYEETIWMVNFKTTSILNMFKGVIVKNRYILWLEEYAYAPTTVKKVVTWKWNSKKTIVRECVISKWYEKEWQSDDFYDSVGVYLTYLEKENITI